MTTPYADVLVVGAGPTGLLLAGDLARAGVNVTILERRRNESNLTRAFVVHARTLELLDARGVADELIKTGKTVGVMQLIGSLDLDLSHLPSRFPYLLSTPQYNTERILEDRARGLGVKIVNAAEAIGLGQGPDGVNVDVRTDEGAQVWRARYVVGADGVHSAVRRALDLPYDGHSAIESVMLADVRLRQEPQRDLVVRTCSEGFSFLASYGDGWYRAIAWDRRRQRPDSAPVSLEEVTEITRLTFGTDYGMHDPRWMSRFHSDERQVPNYRVGRAFLIGDAAQCHSPAGGQGLNTGLGDAANLGWKLAAVVHSWAPDGLLDTYNAERHPVGHEVLRTSGLLLTVAMGEHRWQRVAREILPAAAQHMTPVNRRMSQTMSGIGIAYAAPHGAHRLVGRRARDLRLAGDGPGRLYEALRSGRPVFLTRGELPPDWAKHVDAVAPLDPSRPAMLVRPDAYVAWACDDPAPSNAPPLDAALLGRS